MRKHNIFLTIGIVLLSVIGLIALLSTNIDIQGNIDWGGVFSKQLLFIGIGTIAYIVAWLFDISYFKHWQISGLFLLSVFVLLIITKAFGPVRNGVQRWIDIGSITLQPSEFAKVSIILMTAAIISMKDRYNQWILAGISLATLVPILFLIYIEPHGSMTLINLGIWSFMVFTFMDNQFRNFILLLIIGSLGIGITLLSLGQWVIGVILLVLAVILFVFGVYSREEWRMFFIVAAIVGVVVGGAASIGWNGILRDYQKDRITAFLAQDDTQDCDNCFNVDQSVIAIGSGGFWGKGFGLGTQSRLRFLPERSTDFIFATYTEQFGLVGAVLLLGTYLFIIIRILLYAIEFKDDTFSSMVLAGIAIKLLLEVFINVGTNMGVIPATGSPLPLISAGGSITIMTFFSIGLVQSIIAHNNKLPNSKDFVVENDIWSDF